MYTHAHTLKEILSLLTTSEHLSLHPLNFAFVFFFVFPRNFCSLNPLVKKSNTYLSFEE